MRKFVTAVLSMLALVLVDSAAAQQDVTIREINTIPQDNIDAIKALGTSVTEADLYGSNCTGLIWEGTLCGADVRFTAVVLSDPLNSGNASLVDGNPGRIHIYVRDVAADTEGPEGHGIQIVDGSGGAIGTLDVNVGDVVTIVGKVEPFFSTMQLTPSSIQISGDPRLPGDPILDPIVVSTADVNQSVGPDGAVQINWDHFVDLRGNFVRFENARVLRRTLGDRPDFSVSTDGGVTSVAKYDLSLRFRNDKSDYPSNFNVLTEPFEPPPPGSTVNLQGFLAYSGRSGSDPYSVAVPYGVSMNINPMADADLEVTESPVNVTNVQRSVAYLGADPIEITADFFVDQSRQLTSAKLLYTLSSDPDNEISKNPSGLQGVTYTFVLPAVPDGDFVTYKFYATDNGGGVFEQEVPYSIRSLYNGVTSVSHIQQTYNEKVGDSPLTGYELDMDLVVTLQTDPATGMIFVQDGTDPWSGIYIFTTSLAAQAAGDQIHITHARVSEYSGGLTQLSSIDFEVVSTGGTPFDYVSLPLLDDADLSESYEGMLVRIEGPYVASTNADAPSGPYGEFLLSHTDSPDWSLRVDDLSKLLVYTGNDPATVFSVWEKLEFIQGALYFSFGNFKLVPESLAKDVGPVINTASEEAEVPETFALGQNYPNPFNPTTSIRYDIPVTGLVTLDVFDSLGRKVRTLVSSEHAPGTYSVSFEGAELSSGLYLYRLTAGGKATSRTMILLK